MATKMRAKLRIQKIEKHGDTVEAITFNAVGPKGSYPADGSDEDNTYAKFSPSAVLNISITNPALLGKFVEGEAYYVDFTPVPAA